MSGLTTLANTNTNDLDSGWQIYMRLLKYLKPLLPAFALSIFGYMVFAATTPAQAKLLELLVDAIENKDHDARYYIPPAIAGVYLVRGVGTFLGSYFMALVGTRIVTLLRTEIFGHLMRLPVNYYDSNNSGQIIARDRAATRFYRHQRGTKTAQTEQQGSRFDRRYNTSVLRGHHRQSHGENFSRRTARD
jgi:ABC-type multidrug transport system fused ATPase/permease subunit